MTLLSIVLALIVEQLHALPVARVVRQPVAALCRALEQRFNDGRYGHGAIAWGLGVALPAMAVFGLHVYLSSIQALLAFLLGLGVLYLTMGFRQFSHYFTEVQEALRLEDIELARRILAEWRDQSGDRLSSSDVARLAIEQALVASHRHVFAPLFWFAVLGPAGAVIYRLADLFNRDWGARTDPDFAQFGTFARQAFLVIDWVPVRLTATAFAIVGDFEDAVYCWRTQASRWADGASGILLSSEPVLWGCVLGCPCLTRCKLNNWVPIVPSWGWARKPIPI